jgi:WD40 repeat protein
MPVSAMPTRRLPLQALTAAALLAAGLAFAGDTRLPTADEVRELQKRYQEERSALVKSGGDKRFLPDLLERADAIAGRASAALEKGRFLQASDAYRQARWQLPYEGPHFPEHVAHVFGNLRLRHGNEVLGIAFSGDGRWLATASRDHTVKVWDMNNGHEVTAYRGHDRYVRAVAFSPDGTWIASAGGDADIRIWDPQTGKDVKTLKGTGNYITAMAVSPDGKHLLAAGDDRTLHVYNTADGKINRTIDYMLFGGLRSLAFSSDGTRLAAGADNGYVRLWVWPDMVTVNAVEYWAQQDNEGASNFITFSPNTKNLIRCGSDAIKVYDVPQPGGAVAAGEPRILLTPPDDPKVKTKLHQFTCAAVSKDGRTLFTGCTDGVIRLYDLDSGQAGGTFKGHNGPITALGFNKQGTQLASASTDYTVRLWNFEVVLQSRDFVGHTEPIWCTDFSPDGEQIVSCGADRTCRTWDMASAKTLQTFGTAKAGLTTTHFSPNGKSILTGGGDGVLRLFEAGSGKEQQTFSGHTATVTASAFSADGSKIVSGGADKQVMVFDIKTAKPLVTVDVGSIPMAVAFTPDGKKIVAGLVDQRVCFFDAGSGKPAEQWLAHHHAVAALSFDSRGEQLATCGFDDLVKIWPMASPGRNPVVLTGHRGPVSAVAFRPDGKYLVSAGSDHVVRLWKEDGGTFKEAQLFRGHKDWVTSLAFSKNGYFIVSASADRTLKVWELATRELPLTAEHTGAVECVAMSPDGTKMASGATDKTIKIWDPKTGVELLTIRGHGDAVVALAFSNDSKILYSSGGDRNIRRWDATTGNELPAVDNQQNFTGFINPVPKLAVRPDGKRLIAWVPFDERGTRVSLFATANGDAVLELNDRGKHVLAVAWPRDFKLAALGAKDGNVRVYDIAAEKENPKPLDFQVFQKTGVSSVAFAPDGAFLVAGSETGKVVVIDPLKGTVRQTFAGHTQRVTSSAVSADGKRVVTAGMDNIVRLWDADKGTELRRWAMPPLVQERGGFVTALTFTPDGRGVVTANSNTTLFLLELP